jgi:hypothetical protein
VLQSPSGTAAAGAAGAREGDSAAVPVAGAVAGERVPEDCRVDVLAPWEPHAVAVAAHASASPTRHNATSLAPGATRRIATVITKMVNVAV